MTQFPEHENGKRSADARVNKLDKLARHLGVLIHIDGIPYGSLEKKAPVDLSVPEILEPTRTVIYDTDEKREEPKPNLEVDGTIVVKVGIAPPIDNIVLQNPEDKQILMELTEKPNDVDEEILTDYIPENEPESEPEEVTPAPKKPPKKKVSKKDTEVDKEIVEE